MLKKTFAIFAIIFIAIVLVIPIYASTALSKASKGNSYKDDNGKYITGFQTIEGKTYFFGKNGKMYTDEWVTTTSGNMYYFQKDGTMATNEINLDGKFYEFDSSGKLMYVYLDIWAPFNNLEWGMTRKEVIKALNLKQGDCFISQDYLGEDVMYVQDKFSTGSYTIYSFNEELELSGFNYISRFSTCATIKKVKEGFKKGGFECLEDDESTQTVMYATDNCLGIAQYYDDNIIEYTIFPNDTPLVV